MHQKVLFLIHHTCAFEWSKHLTLIDTYLFTSPPWISFGQLWRQLHERQHSSIISNATCFDVSSKNQTVADRHLKPVSVLCHCVGHAWLYHGQTCRRVAQSPYYNVCLLLIDTLWYMQPRYVTFKEALSQAMLWHVSHYFQLGIIKKYTSPHM